MKKTILILGANGLVGSGALAALSTTDSFLKCVDVCYTNQKIESDKIEYIEGNIFDREFFEKALSGVDVVLNFISTTLPSENDASLEKEIEKTLKFQDYVLSTMISCGVKNYVFPSSGGAVYGNCTSGNISEEALLAPSTNYGVGKKLVEDVIRFYSTRFGLNSVILRIGNVYGSPNIRKTNQGAIDIFVQKALKGEEISLWGNASDTVRDYVYLGDVSEAIKMVTLSKMEGVKTYNVGTGKGTTIKEIIDLIEEELSQKLSIKHIDTISSGVNRIVLNADKIKREIGWESTTAIKDGVQKTIELKRKAFKEV